MDQSAERTKIEWREWGDAAFEEAQDADKPILLSLSARWCSWCHEMDEKTYAVPTLAANVNDSFVPIRADIDRHPRVRERYNMGGFPTTVFLTPEGEHLTGATFLDANTMRQVVGQVRDLWKHKGRDASQVPRNVRDQNPPSGEVTDEIERLLVGQLEDRFDPTNGGWGDDAKFPLPRTVEFALKRDRERALATLSSITANLYDDYEGGFFRYAGTREWNDVHREKMLDVNAALLRTYANAYLYTGEERYRDPAAKTVEYLTRRSGRATPSAEASDPATTTTRATRATGRARRPRRSISPPSPTGTRSPPTRCSLTPPTRTTNTPAATPSGPSISSRRTSRTAPSSTTATATRRENAASSPTKPPCFERSSPPRRSSETRGTTSTPPAPSPTTPSTRFRRTTARSSTARKRVPASSTGRFVPWTTTQRVADALVDLAILTGEESYEIAARDAVGAFAGAADRIGVQVAGYATAASRLCRPPLRVVVATEPGSNLHRAALRLADHEKVVVLDPDGEYERGTARLVDGETVSEPASSPAELSELASSFF